MPGLLDGPAVAKLATILSDVYDDGDMTNLLFSINQPALNHFGPMNATREQAVQYLLLDANQKGWVASLLREIANSPQARNATVIAFFNEYAYLRTNLTISAMNPWNACQLYGGQLFLGRVALRKWLYKMTIPILPKILLVNSEQRQIGKTYTHVLIEFFSSQNSFNATNYLDLDAKVYSLKSLAEEIAICWGIEGSSLPRQADEQEPRWAQQVAHYLVKYTPPEKDGLVRWLILDGFREKIPSPGVKALIEELAAVIQSKPTFRLILINYVEPLPLTVRAYRDVALPLTESDIRSAFMDIHRTIQRMKCDGYANGTDGSGVVLEATEDQIAEYMSAYSARLADYHLMSPEHLHSSLLIHNAVADVVEEM